MKEDWISQDIKAIVDSEGKPFSRERQGRIQAIRESVFSLFKDLPKETKDKIKEIILLCLEKKYPRYRIKQELFDNFASLNMDWDALLCYEFSIADAIAYIKDEVFNSKPDEKIYFKRFEMIDDNTCKKCKKLNGTIVLWSDVPLNNNKTNDKYADYVIWDDRFTEKKSKIPLTLCCKSCRGCWTRYYPELD